MTLDQSDIHTIVAVITELATEIDLHYEDDDLQKASGAVQALQAASAILSRAGTELPEAYLHIAMRFERAGGVL